MILPTNENAKMKVKILEKSQLVPRMNVLKRTLEKLVLPVALLR
jgi:hypothetical protein